MLSLPVCRWRGEATDGTHLCHSAKFVDPPNPVRAQFCQQCYYVDHEPIAHQPRHLPCVHLGPATGKSEECPTCTGRVQLKLFACTPHGHCLPTRGGAESPGTACCQRCPDYLPRDPIGQDSGRMRQRADAFLATISEYPPERYQGRGIVVAGGGDRYFAALYITIRALRHVGCRLPIQVWYLGRNKEMPADWEALLAPFDVECIDADGVRQEHPARRLDGWELKVFATLHSPFEEVLFLDADCYPCRNPEFLFDLEDYRAVGALFWPDTMLNDERLKWAAFAVTAPERPGSIESGQYVLNKRQCWRPLNLAWFYNDHSDYYHRYCYGDKHTFEVAWTRCAQPFVMWQPQAHWVEVAYLHPGPDGEPLFIHRCSDKFRLQAHPFTTPQHHPEQLFVPHLPLERECWNWLGELIRELGASTRQMLRAPLPRKVVRIGLPGHFNCALIEHQGRLLLASRRGVQQARIYLSELDAAYQPLWTRPLEVTHPRVPGPLEDPRLFLFRGQLHCSFTALEAASERVNIHQLFCRLNEHYQAEEVWLPQYPERATREKNWQFFEHAGELFSIYSIRPHRILRHQGALAQEHARTDSILPLPDHHLRGGAPPVRVGDEYYHFFHTMTQREGMYHYAAWVYTFAAQPPFPILRFGSAPVLPPDDHDRPPDSNKLVVFPCGALWRDRHWYISYGYHDRECRLAVFAAEEIESRLQCV